MSYQNPRMSQLFRLEYPQSVGIFGTYDEAQQVVDFLADSRFPVENLCIVGTELRSIERVLGRRSWGTVLGSGLQSGLTTALIVTLVMSLFGQGENILGLFLTALVIGITIGVVMSAVGYWMSRGKRDFRSVSQTVATKYEVLAEHKVAGKARELIATMPGARAAQFDPNQFANPYGAAPTGYPGYPAPPMGYPGYPTPPAGYPAQGDHPAPGGYPYPDSFDPASAANRAGGAASVMAPEPQGPLDPSAPAAAEAWSAPVAADTTSAAPEALDAEVAPEDQPAQSEPAVAAAPADGGVPAQGDPSADPKQSSTDPARD